MKLVGRVARARIADGAMVKVHYPPWHVLVTTVHGEPYAIEDACNHAGASLTAGSRDGDCVVCPLHGYIFDIATGALVAPRGLCEDQRRFHTTIEGDDVVVWDTFAINLINP